MARRKRAARRRKEEYCSFIVEVTESELTYSIMLNEGRKYDPGPYTEFLHLEIKGVLVHPAKYAGKTLDATIIGDRDMVPRPDDPSLPERKPIGVGGITLRGENRQYLGSVPFDVLPTVASMLESKHAKFIDLHGPSPYHGHATIRSMRFFRECDPDDYE